MVSFQNIYHVFEETIPLYTTMILAYFSIKWWNLFTHEQCKGINKFVSKFSIPVLSFQVISSNNPYQMNVKLIFSDILQKSLSFFIFVIISIGCNFDWLITGFSVSTLPNTLIIGIPLLKGMYGDEAVKLISQIVVLQSLVWYIFLLILFEFRATKAINSMDNQNATQVVEEMDPHEAMQVRAGNDEKAPSKRYSSYFSFASIVGRKLLINPNTYASLAGLIWSLISFRWNIKLPKIINNSIHILSDGGLGMAMFSLGLFMASQSKIIACGARMAVLSMGLRFILGPALMAISSYAIGLRGLSLKIAIIQAALPQGIVPFVFAKEYGVHPDILSTGIIIGMIVAVPVTLVYYFLLGLE